MNLGIIGVMKIELPHRLVLFWLLVALNWLDFWLTSQILLNGGVEANPIVDYFIHLFGNVGIIAAKAPALALVGLLVHVLWDKINEKWQGILHRCLHLLCWLFITLNAYSTGIYLTVTS